MFKINWIKRFSGTQQGTNLELLFPIIYFFKVGGLKLVLLCNYNVDKIPVKLFNFPRQKLFGSTQTFYTNTNLYF